MVYYIVGNIFNMQTQALVNPVNTVGVMGAGLALEFKRQFPQNFLRYKLACSSGDFGIGKVLATAEKGKIIINLPTKEHWRNPSQLSYVKSGLDALAEFVRKKRIESVALPLLGCGLGGLDFFEVKTLMDEILTAVTECEWFICQK